MQRFIFMRGFTAAFLFLTIASNAHAADASLLARVEGRILLQVESHGEAWYVRPEDGLRYYMKDGAVAYEMMRSFGLGITDTDLAKVAFVATPDDMLRASSACASNALANRLKGTILLQVEQHGEAWYVHPSTCRRIYLKDGAAAYTIMRLLSLGITNADLERIATGMIVAAPTSGSTTDTTEGSTDGSGGSPAGDPNGVTNPFTNATFYVDPNSNARTQVNAWAVSRPNDAVALEKIASQSTARWFGDWNEEVRFDVNDYVTEVTNAGALPVLVAYNIPDRDCGSYSAGGVADAEAYRSWIRHVVLGIGSRHAVVILEPDATATDCVTDARLALMKDAVAILKAEPKISVYIDAGHDNWVSASDMSMRLTKAGVAMADGFALNVSNFYTDAENIVYGTDLSKRIGNKHFILDTGRNGNGWNGEWCNPSGRAIGRNPTTNTGHALVDALLWVKPPGESDGECNGGPSAGTWWAEYALGLVD